MEEEKNEQIKAKVEDVMENEGGKEKEEEEKVMNEPVKEDEGEEEKGKKDANEVEKEEIKDEEDIKEEDKEKKDNEEMKGDVNEEENDKKKEDAAEEDIVKVEDVITNSQIKEEVTVKEDSKEDKVIKENKADEFPLNDKKTYPSLHYDYKTSQKTYEYQRSYINREPITFYNKHNENNSMTYNRQSSLYSSASKNDNTVSNQRYLLYSPSQDGEELMKKTQKVLSNQNSNSKTYELDKETSPEPKVESEGKKAESKEGLSMSYDYKTKQQPRHYYSASLYNPSVRSASNYSRYEYIPQPYPHKYESITFKRQERTLPMSMQVKAPIQRDYNSMSRFSYSRGNYTNAMPIHNYTRSYIPNPYTKALERQSRLNLSTALNRKYDSPKGIGSKAYSPIGSFTRSSYGYDSQVRKDAKINPTLSKSRSSYYTKDTFLSNTTNIEDRNTDYLCCCCQCQCQCFH